MTMLVKTSLVMAMTLMIATSHFKSAKADPFTAGLFVGGIAYGIWHGKLRHRDKGLVDRSHYYKRLYHGNPKYPEKRSYKNACVKGPQTCEEKNECWHNNLGNKICGIRRYCRRRVYCD